MAALYFTVTGVQFWGTSYMLIILHAPLPVVNGLFILCAASGPTLGVFAGVLVSVVIVDTVMLIVIVSAVIIIVFFIDIIILLLLSVLQVLMFL
jgi:hypothetical protein